MNGFAGKVLHVDLTTGTTTVEQPTEDFYRHYMGGRRWWAVYAVALVIIAHNVGYLWTKKHAQYEERAVPTEALIEMVTEHKGPVYVRCFPYGEDVARKAVEVGAGLPASLVVWNIDPPDACDSGFSLSRNPNGHVRKTGTGGKRARKNHVFR